MSTKKKSYDNYFKDIEKYYKMKSTYEHKHKKEKDKIIANTNYPTMQEKREKLKTFKPKCNGCKKKVGMIFTNTPEILSIKCGDEENPCALQFNVKKLKVVPQYPLIGALKKEINQNVMDIIKLKLDVLFAFSSENEIGSSFSKVRDTYMKNNKLYRNTLQTYKNTINRSDKQEEIETKKIELHKYTSEVQDMIEKYKQTQRDEFIAEINEIYTKQIIPLVEKIRELTYSYQKIEFNSVDEVYKLIQEPYTIHDIETFIKK